MRIFFNFGANFPRRRRALSHEAREGSMRGICDRIVMLCMFTASSNCFSLIPPATLSVSLMQKHHRCQLPPSLALRCSADWESASVDGRQNVPELFEKNRFGLDRRALIGLGCGILSALSPGWGWMQQAAAVSLGDSGGAREGEFLPSACEALQCIWRYTLMSLSLCSRQAKLSQDQH